MILSCDYFIIILHATTEIIQWNNQDMHKMKTKELMILFTEDHISMILQGNMQGVNVLLKFGICYLNGQIFFVSKHREQ